MAAAGSIRRSCRRRVSTVQAAIREQPTINTLVLLVTLGGGGDAASSAASCPTRTGDDRSCSRRSRLSASRTQSVWSPAKACLLDASRPLGRPPRSPSSRSRWRSSRRRTRASSGRPRSGPSTRRTAADRLRPGAAHPARPDRAVAARVRRRPGDLRAGAVVGRGRERRLVAAAAEDRGDMSRDGRLGVAIVVIAAGAVDMGNRDREPDPARADRRSLVLIGAYFVGIGATSAARRGRSASAGGR